MKNIVDQPPRDSIDLHFFIMTVGIIKQQMFFVSTLDNEGNSQFLNYFCFRIQMQTKEKHLTQFQSVKIGHNILWTEVDNNSPDTLNTLQTTRKGDFHGYDQRQTYKTSPQKINGEICNLEDIWNAVQDTNNIQTTTKTPIMNIHDEPCTLTVEEYQQIFGSPSKEKQPEPRLYAEQLGLELKEEGEDFGQLWQELDEIDLVPKAEPEDEVWPIKEKSKQLDLPQDEDGKQVQPSSMQEERYFFQIQEKDAQSQGRICLVLGKNFHIYDLYSFLTNSYKGNIYSYFGFQEEKPNCYSFYDLTTNEPLMSCSVSKYEKYAQNIEGKKQIHFSTDYCLKMRLREGGEPICTIWQKSTSNGVLYNVRLYNYFEDKHQESLALIEISDGYIGNNCYCNTTVYISQKHNTQKGPLKMRLSLKNGYLIAHMGVSGIKSAPYNCRLQNSKDSFLYLLGMLQKDERFLVRLGEGMSPVIAFTISIGRKRYIDSFKD